LTGDKYRPAIDDYQFARQIRLTTDIPAIPGMLLWQMFSRIGLKSNMPGHITKIDHCSRGDWMLLSGNSTIRSEWRHWRKRHRRDGNAAQD